MEIYEISRSKSMSTDNIDNFESSCENAVKSNFL